MRFEVVAVEIDTGLVHHVQDFGENEVKAKQWAGMLDVQFKGAVKYFVVVCKSLDKGAET